MLLLVDNYDSFTWNLAHQVARLWREPLVLRPDELPAGLLEDDRLQAVLLSPGPGRPDDGPLVDLLSRVAGRVPVLGICLGCQAIARMEGVPLLETGTPLHGKTRSVTHEGRGLFRGLANPLPVARYHSLAVRVEDLPSTLRADAHDGPWAMALADETRCLYGVQFHPESFLTPSGDSLLLAFRERAEAFLRTF